jgi:hypothetical protein
VKLIFIRASNTSFLITIEAYLKIERKRIVTNIFMIIYILSIYRLFTIDQKYVNVSKQGIFRQGNCIF